MKRKDWLNHLFTNLGVAFFYWLLSWLSVQLFQLGSTLPILFWPASGFAVAVAYRYRWHVVPGLYVGAFFANLLLPEAGWGLAAFTAIMSSLAPVIMVSLIQRITHHQEPFLNMSDFVYFILGAVLIHPVLTVASEAGGRLLLGSLQVADSLNSWLAQALGTLLFAPIFLVCFYPSNKSSPDDFTFPITPKPKPPKTLFKDLRKKSTMWVQKGYKYWIVFGLTLLVTSIMFFAINPFPLGLPYLLIIPMAWVAIRYSMFRTVLLFTFVILIGLTSIILNPVYQVTGATILFSLRIMIAAYSLVLLTLSIIRRLQLQVEDSLRESESKLRRIADNISDVVFTTDLEMNTTYISPSVEKLIGESAEKFITRSLDERYPPGAKQTMLQVAAEEFEKEKDPTIEKDRSRIIEVEYYRADGSIIFVSTHASFIRDENGNPIGFQGVTRDITERKKAEEEILKLNQELELRVRERTAQLTAANQELEAFSYSVSHDLRTPLRALEGFSNILLSEYSDLLDELGRNYLSRIHEAAQRMGQLINDLLNLSMINRAEFSRQSINLSKLAHLIAQELEEQSPLRQVRFEIDPHLSTQGDANLIKIALENLLHNAFKFTGKREQAVIEIGKMEPQGECVFFVRDNGAGFNMEYAAKLFTPFQRLHGVQEFSGTGIGLSIVQRIISRHGGRIWAESEIDQGATFYFTLGDDQSITNPKFV